MQSIYYSAIPDALPCIHEALFVGSYFMFFAAFRRNIIATTVPLNIMQHPILIQPLPELCKAPFNIMYTYLKSQQELIIYGHGQAELVTTKELASERVLLAEMRLKYSLFYGW